MKAKIKLWVIRLIAAVACLFVIQIVYQSISYEATERSVQNTGTFASARKNYAQGSNTIQSSTDRYEKVAAMNLHSSSFNESKERLIQMVSERNGVIQFEKLTGSSPERIYSVQIGVTPDRFDDTVESIQNLANVSAIAIEKNDKTSDYLQKLAAKEALIQSRQSLIQLKTRPGSMEELMKLENRLLELENEIRKASLEAGQYQIEQDLCTIRVTLHESSLISTAKTVIIDSLLWTVALTVMISFFAAGIAFVIWILLMVKPGIEKLIKNDSDS